MKKFVCLYVPILILAALLTGCSEKKETSGGPVKLTFYNQKEQLPIYFEELVKKFAEQNSGIEIEVISPPDSETALFARVSTGDVPDIVHLWPAEPPYKDMMEEGLFLDLTGQEFLKRAMPEYVEMSNYKGKSYAMPTTISFYGLWINKDIFSRYNLAPPTTHDELIAVCEVLKANGVQPFVFKDKNPAQEFERMIGITNPDVTTVIERIARGETSFTREPEARALAEDMLEVRKYGQVDTLGTDDSQARTDFFAQKAAMYTSGTWLMADVKNFPGVNLELIPYPCPIKGRPSKMPINIDIAYSIAADMSDAKTQGALKFIDFLTSPDIAQDFANFEGGPCIITSVKQDTPELNTVMEQISKKNTFLTVLNFWNPGLRPAWVPAVQNMLMTKDIDAFIAESDKLIKTVYTSN
ncbi:MAG: extracellular solute-binding protein [Treponema sp.]|jgi:raffinose/stachyose/melibiose transport system substrate-binding protein|nr:extracellular solute-binding protein [Treponema sp.]